MFGSLLDRIFVASSNRNGNLLSQIEHHSFSGESPSEKWICFIPEFCYRFPPIRDRLIPYGINADVYLMPKTIVRPNPELTCGFLDDVLDIAIQRQTGFNEEESLNVLGISLGNVLAFRFAEYFQTNKLISVVPGSRLAECIFESIATDKIVRSSGRNLVDYKKALSEYNPIELIPRINPRYSEVHLGTSDLMIPYNRGKELAEAMQNSKLKPNLHFYRFSGHVETITSFSRRFSKTTRKQN